MSAGDSINPQLVDRKGRLWQERTVVVKKEDGFGFTLTQEMPVFVDKVFNGSSAQKAGIHPKDRIIKVNGVSVVGHKHQDVVDMIKDSSHVTLTVISKLPSSNGGHRSVGPPVETTQQSNVDISPPRQLQELTLQSLKTMLHKQRKNYESLSVDYSKQRTDKLEKELRDCEGIIRILEVEIASKSPAIEAHIKTTAASVQSLTPDKMMRPSVDLRMLGMEGDGIQKPVSPNKANRMGNGSGGEGSPRPNRSHTFSNGSISPVKPWRPFKKIDLSDEDSDDGLSVEVDGADEAGPFSSLQDLKGNPAHMSVFLHYLFMSKDPKYLLFYLVASGYQSHCKGMEMLKQRGMDIYWTFFLDNSPLHLNIDDTIRLRILHNIEHEESESRLKSVFVEARESLAEMIINDLGNYRHKRVLGLAAMFGDQLVTSHMPLNKQLDVASSLLAADLKTCLDEKSAANLQESLKNHATAACVATYLLEVLSSGNKTSSKLPSILEKIQPFTRPDILLKKGKPKKKLPTVTRSGHTFQLTSFKSPTNCDHCGRPLWGVVYHGYQCSVCETSVHRYCCVGEVSDCSGQVKPQSSKLPRGVHIRKPSTSRKQNLTVAPLVEESGTGSGSKPDSAPSPAANTTDPDQDRVSPPMNTPSPRTHGEETSGGEPDSQTLSRKQQQQQHQRGRAVSDPKLALSPNPTNLPPHRPSLGGAETTEQPRAKPDLTRTQSERLQKKPDSVHKQRSIEANTLSWGGGELSPADEAQLSSSGKPGSSEGLTEGKQQLVDEDIEELLDDSVEEELIPWALMARREVVQSMKRYEVARQENIRELVYTERTHLHKLKIMKYLYKIPLQKQNILSAHQVEQLFPSLEELILFHSGLCADLKERVGFSNQDTPIVRNIADVLLNRFDGAAGERLCHACSIFASNQAKAEKLTKEWKRKNDRFRLFLKTAETHPESQRLTLSELMPIAWTRLTRYKLLVENIYHTYKKNWDSLEEADKVEANQVEMAIGCIKSILKHVNKQVKWATNRQKLAYYQSKIDLASMEKSSHPIAQLFKNLDLTAENRMLIHEGLLAWKIQHKKVVELHALLLTDILVLLEKQEDKEKEKYFLRTHTVESVSGTKEELSTVIRLKDCLLRTAAADRGGRTFLLVNNSSLMKFAQMYEFIAENPKEKKKWEDSIERAMMGTQSIMSPELPSSPLGEDYGRLRMTFASHLNTREQLDKIDDDIKKLMNEKLDILRSIQVGVGHRSSNSTPKHTMASSSDSPKDIVASAIEQTGEILSTVSHIMVPNPTKTIVAETQSRLTDIVCELERNLSKLTAIMKEDDYRPPSSVGRMPSLDFTTSEESSSSADALPLLGSEGSLGTKEGVSLGEGVAEGLRSYQERLFAIGERKEEEEAEEVGGASNSEAGNREKLQRLPSATVSIESGGGAEDDDVIVAPPDIFSGGDNCATPTPGDFLPLPGLGAGAGTDSGTSTPRYLDSPSTESLSSTKGSSPLASYLLKAEKPSEVALKEKSKTLPSSNLASSHKKAPEVPAKPVSGTKDSGAALSSGQGRSSPATTPPKKEPPPVPIKYSKLSIGPRNSPAAAATSHILSILSNSPKSSRPGSSASSADSHVTTPGDSRRGSGGSSTSEEGTTM